MAWPLFFKHVSYITNARHFQSRSCKEILLYYLFSWVELIKQVSTLILHIPFGPFFICTIKVKKHYMKQMLCENTVKMEPILSFSVTLLVFTAITGYHRTDFQKNRIRFEDQKQELELNRWRFTGVERWLWGVIAVSSAEAMECGIDTLLMQRFHYSSWPRDRH